MSPKLRLNACFVDGQTKFRVEKKTLFGWVPYDNAVGSLEVMLRWIELIRSDYNEKKK